MPPHALLPALLSSPTTALVGATLDGTITHWSLGATALLGWTEDEVVGRPLTTLLPEDRKGELHCRDAVLEGDSVPPFETVRLARDGTPVEVELHVVPLHDQAGAVAGSLALLRDLRRACAAEARVREQAAKFDALADTMPVAVLAYDRDGRCTSWDGEAVPPLGSPASVGTVLPQEPGLAHVREALSRSLAGAQEQAVVEGERSWKCHFRPVLDADGEVVGGMAVAVDVSQLVAAEREVRSNEARLRALLRHSGELALVVDDVGRVLWVSPAVEHLLGLHPAGLFWSRVRDLTHPEDHEGIAATWRRVLSGEAQAEAASCRLQHADGTWRWFEYRFSDRMADPDIGGMVVNLRDVSERRAAEHELQRTALKDPLTGLANRALLLDRIRQALTWERRSETLTGLVLLDVVGMAAVNEAVGHACGDLVLQTVAARLADAVRGTDSVARTGSDEFAVLVEDVPSAEDLRARAAHLVDALSGPVVLEPGTVDVVLRAASVLSPAEDEGALLAAAERALAGPHAPSRVVVERAAALADDGQAERVADLRRGIAAGELRLHYQPVLRLDSGEVAGAEALVRWQHPERGLLPPSEFVPLAESSGLVVDLGEWVLREACRRAAAWQAAGRHLGVGVNLSPRQMVGGDLVGLLRDVLADTGAAAGRVVLEVTESTLMDDPEAPEVLHALRRLGVRLALDDFGTGYSSLTYLKRFPIDAIKIDRSFVSGLGRDADDEAIVASVVSLAQSVGKLVVAEGVETPAQLAVLRSLGVEQGQGFHWSPALPAAELDDWLDLPARRPQPPGQAAGSRTRARTDLVVVPSEDEHRILRLHREGASLHTIAAALNAEGRRTPAGPRWTPTTVARVVSALASRA